MTVTAPATCSSAVQNVDLAVTKVVDKTTVRSGDAVRYTVTVTNNGPGDAIGVELTDQLPAGVTYTVHSVSQGTYSNSGGIWIVGTLASGSVATLELDVMVD